MPDEKTPVGGHASPPSSRKVYSPPQLVVHGTVSALTATGKAAQSEQTVPGGSQAI